MLFFLMAIQALEVVMDSGFDLILKKKMGFGFVSREIS